MQISKMKSFLEEQRKDWFGQLRTSGDGSIDVKDRWQIAVKTQKSSLFTGIGVDIWKKHIESKIEFC